MTARAFVVYATRADGSTAHAVVHPSVLLATVAAVHATGLAARVSFEPVADGVAYVDRSPMLPIDDALAWRQPTDALTRVLRPA